MSAQDAEADFDFSDLNRQFYSANPAAFFDRRLYLLILAGGRPEDLDCLLAAGVDYAGIRVKVDLEDASAESGRLHEAFLIAESQMLLHHVAEALIRLYLGHVGTPACPWMECGSLRTPKEFWKRVDEIIGPGPSKNNVAEVFLGGMPKGDDVERNDAVAASGRLLRFLAKKIREDANLYNSTKHGMTVIPGESFMSLGDDATGKTFLSTSGPSVVYLESKGRGDERLWSQTTRWIDVHQNLCLIVLAIRQIAALWEVARARYTDHQADGVSIVTSEAVETAVSGRSSTYNGMTRFSIVVAVEKPLPRPGKSPRRGQ